ncbi:MAG TPA: Coq4 family protein, partial [Rhizomicrobium sp.]|nr:Coq4 family protein [Rhizomicrobium sp.]
AFTAGYLGEAMPEVTAMPGDGFVLPRAFWDYFWGHLDAQRTGAFAPEELTARVAMLGVTLPVERRDVWEAASRAHPKTAEAHLRPMPPKLTLQELAVQPEDSLARDFHALIVAMGFDLEVLDRSGLETLPPALAYLNARILQMHDVWHLMGGFRFTALHEVAISTFQLEQFNHGYSAMFLAAAATGIACGGSDGAPVMLTIAEAWQHARATPSLMGIAWEKEWSASVDDLRTRHGIKAFKGSLPPDLFECPQAA